MTDGQINCCTATVPCRLTACHGGFCYLRSLPEDVRSNARDLLKVCDAGWAYEPAVMAVIEHAALQASFKQAAAADAPSPGQSRLLQVTAWAGRQFARLWPAASHLTQTAQTHRAQDDHGDVYQVQDIAAALLRLSAARRGYPLNQLQLQKLVYLTHGLYLAIFGKSLIGEAVLAGEFDPEFASLRQACAGLGTKPLRLEQLATGKRRPRDLDRRSLAFVTEVFNCYAGYQSYQLSALTHAADSPWTRTRSESLDDHPGEISNTLILAYFCQLIGREEAAA